MKESMFNKIQTRGYVGLDGLRFYCVAMTIFVHLYLNDESLLSLLSNNGWVGVDIFFVLSGFVITLKLKKEISPDKNTFQYLNFLKERAIRLWPAWLLILLVSSLYIIFVKSKGSDQLLDNFYDKFLYYLFHLGNYSFALDGKLDNLFVHFWSLAVEEHFYLAWPLVYVFVVKATNNNNRRITIILTLISIIPLLFRLFILLSGRNYIAAKFMSHTRFDELLFGCILAVNFNEEKIFNRIEYLINLSLSVLFFWLGLVIFNPKDSQNPPMSHVLNYSYIGFGAFFLIRSIVYGRGSTFNKVFFENKLISRLGVLSYNVYLIHLLVYVVLGVVFKKLNLIGHNWTLAFANIILSHVIAIGMYLIIDMKFRKIIQRKLSKTNKTKENTN